MQCIKLWNLFGISQLNKTRFNLFLFSVGFYIENAEFIAVLHYLFLSSSVYSHRMQVEPLLAFCLVKSPSFFVSMHELKRM